MNIFTTLITQPIFNALILLYDVVGDIGVSIIIITILIKLLLLPLANKALRSQRRLQALQPELTKLQEKHKDDRETLSREIMAFYKKEGVSPASSCLPTLLQIPILIGLYFVFRDAISGDHSNLLYSFVPNPGTVNTEFLGVINLAQRDALVLPLITALLQFWQSRMLLPKDLSGPAAMNKQLIYIFPIVTFIFAATLPAALPLYWATSTLFTIIQQYIIIRSMPLPEAKVQAAKDWDAANPDDQVPVPKLPAKRRKKTKGASVTVRQRGKK